MNVDKEKYDNAVTDNAMGVLKKRYFRNGERTWTQLVDRVVDYVTTEMNQTFAYNPDWIKEMMYDMRFLPNSPTMMNSGVGTKQLSACFTLPIDDSIESIFETVKSSAIIFKSGGGVGINLGKLRPEGAKVASSGGKSSGPVSFMEPFDTMAETVKQGGTRRGAFMCILPVTHPDIMKFIHCKQDLSRLNNMNLSVLITSGFMEAVEADGSYELMDGTLRSARVVMEEIAKCAAKTGEPGIIFGKNVSDTDYENESDIVTNPCGEQCLPPFGSCNLGSLNLSKYVKDDKSVLYIKLEKEARQAALFLDAIRQVNVYPLPEIEEESRRNPRVGLGIMGLADALIKLDVPYSSQDGREVASRMMQVVTGAAHDAVPHCVSVTTIAPTGSLSMIADCSGGCEPRFSNKFVKTVIDGTPFEFEYEDYKNATQEQLDAGIFKTAQDMAPESHILMQAALQPFVTNSISKTINMPSDATAKDVMDAYMFAYKHGCKGLTVYVDGCRDNQVLTTSKSSDKVEEDKVTYQEQPVPYKLELPDKLDATRYRLNDPNNRKIYFTVCDMDGKPVEVFTKLPTEEGDSYYHTISRLLSLAMRYNIPLEDITSQLRKSSSSVSDLPSRIARVLDRYIGGNEEEKMFIDEEEGRKLGDICNPEEFDLGGGHFWKCPECDYTNLEKGGCRTCKSCGYSSCV